MKNFFEIHSQFLLISSIKLSAALSKHPIIVITAFDGFRYDYLNRGFTQILEEISNNGTRAKYMLNQFPTLTFPNFHSIATGMHTETHGLLGNYAFNEKNQCIGYSYELFHYNEDIIPIWNLNELSGDERYSGVMTWPGSEYEYQERLPTFYSINYFASYRYRVDMVLDWILNANTPANLVYMHFERPDSFGHYHGPNSVQVNDQLQSIDNVVAYFLQQLEDKGIRDKVNLFFLSDHGMVSVKSDQVINLELYVDSNSYTVCGESPGLRILPNPGFENEVYENLTAAMNELKTFVVYRHDEIPDRWHYKNNKRNVGFFLLSNLGYVFQDAKIMKGEHGYDNEEPTMYPIFLAIGPLIREHHEIQPFQNIDLYPLISYVLKLNMLPPHLTTNGSLSNVLSLLKDNVNYDTVGNKK